MAQQAGIDYSFSHPSPSSIAAAGYTFVMRYLTRFNTFGKILTGAEATALHGAGLTIGLVYEDEADRALAGNAAGVSDGNTALAQANALGVPASRPIYFACDSGTTNDLTNYGVVSAYFSGVASVLGVGRTGMYGGGNMWSQLFGAGIVSGFFWEASAYSWSNYKVPYPGAIILQSLGSVLGGTSDPDTAYVADFGQWPAPTVIPPTPVPNPKPGGTNVANVSNSGGYAQPSDQSLITPQETHDQTVYSVTTSDATLATGSHSGFYEIPTTIKQTAYPIGTFSYDGGKTFNDFGFALPVTPGTGGVYPGVYLQPSVDGAGNIFFNGVNNTGGTVSLIINVALLATYNPGLLPQIPKLSGNLGYTNVYPKLTADATTRPYSSYRRIAKDGASGTGASITVAHGQGVIPNIMFWVNVGGLTTLNPVGWKSTGSMGALGIKMDTNNLYFHVDGATYNNAYYRVYKDN